MDRKTFLSIVPLLIAGATLPAPTLAEDNSTKEEAKAMVDAAMAHVKKVGVEQALKDFQNDKATWVKRDLYIFAYTMKGINLVLGANDKMVGRDLIDMRDPNGKYIIKEMIAVTSAKGSGWVDYEFANPATKKIAPKTSYVVKLPNYDGFLGVGIYK